jgi:hypothetical protein
LYFSAAVLRSVLFAAIRFGVDAKREAVTDPRDLVAVVEGVESSVNTGGLILSSMGPEVANALASNIISWYTKNRSSINDAARMRRIPVVLDPAEIRVHCIKEGTLDFLDSVP